MKFQREEPRPISRINIKKNVKWGMCSALENPKDLARRYARGCSRAAGGVASEQELRVTGT